MSAKTSAVVPSHAALAASSLLFSMTLYGLMRGVLAIPIPVVWFAGTLVAQVLLLLLGRTILTPLGGCVLSLLAALAGLGTSMGLIFRGGFVLPLGGLIAAGVATLAAILLFLLVLAGATRSRSAQREDAPPDAPEVVVKTESGPEPVLEIMTVLEPAIEPEIGPVDEPLKADLFEDLPEGAVQRPEGGDQTWTRSEDAGEHEFDFLAAPPAMGGVPAPEAPVQVRSALDEEAMRMVEDAFLKPEGRDEVGAALDDIANLEAGVEGKERESEIQGDWADRDAGKLAGDAQGRQELGFAMAEPLGPDSPSAVPFQGGAAAFASDSGALSMAPVRRPKFRILRAGTGETLRTFHCDAGYSSLDLPGLCALLTRELHGKEPRIVGINWFDLDQVEVLVEEAAAKPQPEPTPVSPPRMHAQPVHTGPIRYLIYDRKTFTIAGEYVPEGRFPRLDRLTLHRILPQYDFRTVVIEAIRWVGQGEVRIYVRGDEKGKGAQPAVPRPADEGPGAARPRRKGPAA